MDFPGGSDGKASVCNVGDLGSIPGSGRSPGEGNGQSTPVLLPGKSHGQRSLVGYSPWGHKELDTTELLHFHFHFVSGESTKDMNGPQISKDSHQPWKSSTWLYPLVLAMRKGRNAMFFIAIIGLLIVKLWDKFFRKMGQASSLDTGSMFSGTHWFNGPKCQSTDEWKTWCINTYTYVCVCIYTYIKY